MNDIASPALARSLARKSNPGVEAIPISDRASWLAMRKRDVTASAAGALLGVHPYITAYGLWALKSGRIDEDPEETAPMRRGRLLEPVAVQMLREEHPDWIFDEYPHRFYYRDPVARIGATPDLLARDQLGRWGVIQIKTVEPGVFRRTWHNEDGELAPPLWIAVQAIVEAHLTKVEWAAAAPMVVGFGLEMPLVPIPIHAGIIDRIKSEVAAFWHAVDSGMPPDPDYLRDGRLLEQMFVGSDEIVDLSGDNALPELADERAKLSADAKAADIRIREIKGEFLAKLGGAGAGRLADGRLITAKRINRKGYSVEPSSYVTVTVKEARS